jgi:RimJ/RimL family protein N-acetyltransferase
MSGMTQPAFEPVEIRDGGVLVRPWEPADVDAVYRACQDPAIQRWTTIPRPYGHGHAEGFVTSIAPAAWAAGTGAHFAVADPGTGEVLGSCGLVTLDRATGFGEIGYWTAPWARGRGVATDAARAVASWALGSLGLRRLQWQAEVGNWASLLVAARLGFTMEGLGRQTLRRGDGTYADGWVAGLLPGELRPAGTADSADLARTRVRAAIFAGEQPELTGVTPGGETVRLRPLRPADVPVIVEACADPLVAKYTSVPNPYTEADAVFFQSVFAPQCWVHGTEVVFAIADGEDRYCGAMSIRLPGDPTTTRIGDVGYLVAPWARGRRYAPTALRAMCDWGFDTLALERIEWRAFEGNDASRSVAERAGFTVEGFLRSSLAQRGEIRDAWMGAILATDR